MPSGPHDQPSRPRRPRLPETPVRYLHLLRGPTRAWWRPIVSFLVLVAAFALLTVPAYLITMAYGLLSGEATIDTIGSGWIGPPTSPGRSVRAATCWPPSA